MPHRKAAVAIVESVESVWRKTTRGARIYLTTPLLLGLLAVTLTGAAGSAMVIVNTGVIVKGMGRSQGDVALALAAHGGGSMLVALALPLVLQHITDRTVMLTGALFLTVTLRGLAGLAFDWPYLLAG